MYVFYGDESGFSKGGKLEPSQPITVFAGILVNISKLQKAIRTFDSLLDEINEGIGDPIGEIKFSDIKSNSYPYNSKYPRVDDKCDLLFRVVEKFREEISYSLYFSAICDADFYEAKKEYPQLAKRLTHPYLAAVYHVLSRVEHSKQSLKQNKGNTFVVLDQQQFQPDVEALIVDPLHIDGFTQIIDTAYFGKSHHSRLLQIADLLAGILRYDLFCEHTGKSRKHFDNRIGELAPVILQDAEDRECFPKGELRDFYQKIEKLPRR